MCIVTDNQDLTRSMCFIKAATGRVDSSDDNGMQISQRVIGSCGESTALGDIAVSVQLFKIYLYNC